MMLRSALSVMVLWAAVAGATSPSWWVSDTASDLVTGEGDGVAITSDGRLVVGPRWSSGPELEEPVVLAWARDTDGSLLVGTAHPAALYRVRGEEVTKLADVPGEQVTAMTLGPDGDPVLAVGTPAVVYRWRKGELEEVGRLDDGGIWDMVVFDGRVVAATGAPAALYRLQSQGLERWLELPDRHARCLEVAAGRLTVGTSGEGLILSVGSDGSVGLVTDSPFTEISGLAVAGDGSVWATALVGEPPPPPAKKTDSGTDDEKDTKGGTTDSVSVALDLPKVGGATATSEVLRLTPEGALLSVHRFTSQVATAIAWDGEGILVGTGFEGEVWRFVNDGGSLLGTVDAVQVVGFVGTGEALLTQGPTAIRWRDAGISRPPRFRSAPKSFERPVRFGRFSILPAAEDVRVRFRSGVSAEPDGTWLPWSDWLSGPAGSVPLPPGKTLQWEVELPPARAGAEVDRLEVASREINLAPEIESIDVEDPAVIFLASPPPSGPVVDADSPDVSGIFTVVDEKAQPKAPSTKGKPYFRVGYRTVSWKVDDPNKDALRFSLQVEREDGVRLPVRDRLEGNQLALDMTAVPDGMYRFRLEASDEIANPGDGRRAESVSSWFEVDGTAPTIEIQMESKRWRVTVRDGESSVLRVEASRDGGEWQSLAASDGVLDGPQEEFYLPVVPGRHLVVVRALDRHFNRVTASVTEN
jgi:hypothetical protein